MNTKSKHILTSNKKYNSLLDKEYLLTPISEIDVQIINELLELFKKIGKSDIVATLDNYKLNPDSEILEALIELNTEYKSSELAQILNEENEDEQKVDKMFFNNTKNDVIKVKQIYRYSDGVDEKGYFILLNETDESVKTVPLHANTKLYYTDILVLREDLDILNSL